MPEDLDTQRCAYSAYHLGEMLREIRIAVSHLWVPPEQYMGQIKFDLSKLKEMDCMPKDILAELDEKIKNFERNYEIYQEKPVNFYKTQLQTFVTDFDYALSGYEENELKEG